MGLRIKRVQEPANSKSIIENYEKIFDIDSERFYSLYKLGLNPINDFDIASDWSFYYEIFCMCSEDEFICLNKGQAKGAMSPLLLS